MVRFAAARNRAYSRARLRYLRQAEVPLKRAKGRTFWRGAPKRCAGSRRLGVEVSLMASDPGWYDAF